MDNLVITNAIEADFSAIQAIYGYYVENTTVSLEEVAPTTEEMLGRWRHYTSGGLPYLVAKIGDHVVGYAYAFQYRPRSAYRFTVEESVYVSKAYCGHHIGHRLLSELMRQCHAQGCQQMLAVIAGTDNAASLKFHETMGFYKAGTLAKTGFKFNRWIDTIVMQKALQP